MITENQFKEAAKSLDCAVSRIKAVYEVEANGEGYLDDGAIKGQHDSLDRVKILFEGHRFWKILEKQGIPWQKLVEANKKFPNVIYEKWNRKQYKGGAAEWDRVSQAYMVCDFVGMNRMYVLESASYGSFQIMGENYALCGYGSAQEMLAAYNNGGEYEQLKSFIKFVINNKLDRFLRLGIWELFAKGYNGTGYRENKYDSKLAAADNKYSI